MTTEGENQIERGLNLDWVIGTRFTNVVVTMTGEDLIHCVKFGLTSKEITIEPTSYSDFMEKFLESSWIQKNLLDTVLEKILTLKERIQIAGSHNTGDYIEAIRESITPEEVSETEGELKDRIAKWLNIPADAITISQNTNYGNGDIPYKNQITIEISNREKVCYTIDWSSSVFPTDTLTMNVLHWDRLYYTTLQNGMKSVTKQYDATDNLLAISEDHITIILSRIQAYRENVESWLKWIAPHSVEMHPKISVKIIDGKYMIRYPKEGLAWYVIGDKNKWWSNETAITVHQMMTFHDDGRSNNEFPPLLNTYSTIASSTPLSCSSMGTLSTIWWS